MVDRPDAFLAHVIVTGKGNLTADEQATLQQLASRWIKPGDTVRTVDPLPLRPGADAPDPGFTGTVASTDGATATVALDVPMVVQTQDGASATATERIVPVAWLEHA